jgi:hypothetical protein
VAAEYAYDSTRRDGDIGPAELGPSRFVHLQTPEGFYRPRERLRPRAQSSPQLVDRVAWRRSVARGAHLWVGEGQGALVVEEAPDPRVGGIAEQYHVPTTGLIGSGMGG